MNNNTLKGKWFTEVCHEHGSAFSLKLKEQLHHEKTPYQTIEIYSTESFGNLMVIDGFVMLTSKDNFLYHEMMTHPVLFTHEAPKNVVIIGGGDCGSLQEVLKHPTINYACQIEIDEQVTRLAEQYFPELCTANDNPRADLQFVDGIKWMQNATAASIDIIIIDSTDPIGPAEGLFCEPFYRECHRVLREGGILVQQSESPFYHFSLIKQMRQAMTAAGFSSLKTLCFPQVVYPSGWWSATLAGKNKSLNTFREQDARNKSFASKYYNADIHKAALVLPEFMRCEFE